MSITLVGIVDAGITLTGIVDAGITLTGVADATTALGGIVDGFVSSAVPLASGMPIGLLLALTYTI